MFNKICKPLCLTTQNIYWGKVRLFDGLGMKKKLMLQGVTKLKQIM